jgi:hypothetical protein
MKDLILIGAHCPDDEREQFLIRLVNQLQTIRDSFDILICSHLYIPEHITKKVDYFFYDKNNELLYDSTYLNQPWFSPFEGMTILSTLVSNQSTYLAVYRILISGLGISKSFGYKKVHYLEYDTDLQDTSDLILHSKLLDEYDWIAIKKEEENFSLNNLDCPIGNFYSFNLDSVPDIFLVYDRERLLNILFKSLNKTNEKITDEIMTSNHRKVLIRDFFTEISQKNVYGLSRNTNKDSLDYWVLPYYNSIKNVLSVVVWNNKDYGPIDVVFLINDDKVIKFNNIKKFEWSIVDVGDINDVNKITILINGKLKNNIIFDDSYREKFKDISYVYYTENK